MTQTATLPPASETPVESGLSQDASRLGYEIVDIAGFLDTVEVQARSQSTVMQNVRDVVDRLSDTNASVRDAISAVTNRSQDSMAAVTKTVDTIHSSGKRTEKVASWVRDLDARMTEVQDQLGAVTAQNKSIAEISAQVNILAINAKIEAARAGDAGLGFAVVAEAINDLSRKTATSAESISESIKALSAQIVELRDEATQVGATASSVLDDVTGSNDALSELSERIGATHEDSKDISARAGVVRETLEEFEPAFIRLSDGFTDTLDAIESARMRSHELIDRSERIVQASFGIGPATEDQRFIDRVQGDARQISERLEAAVDQGQITLDALFSTRYQPVPGSNPEQVLLPVTALSDRLFPDIQEPVLEFDPKVVFCAAVDRNGYLPTHNRKFSKPQGSDPDWNAANSRNRRMFDDRVGLKAGRNTEPFLMQVYRRDMGGGQFRMMKDLSAPIMVHGRHWGGLRLAYSFE